MAGNKEEYEKIVEEMAEHYNKHYAKKFGSPMGKVVSESNAVTEDRSRDLGAGLGSVGIFGEQSLSPTQQAVGNAALGAQASPMSPEALRQAQMAAFNQPRPFNTGMKKGGKVSKSGRSYRGYGKARIPS